MAIPLAALPGLRCLQRASRALPPAAMIAPC